MLAGGLASAVKEYVRKFSGGPGEAVVMVSWAPALMKIIKHNPPLNCPEPWEVYTDCSGSYEQADVLRGVHSRRAVAKDALPRILRLRPEERIKNASQQAPAQPQPRKRRAPTSSSAPARETQTATRPTRITRTTAEPEVGVVPSPPREVQEISSSSSPEQPPRKEPWVGEPPQQSEGRQGDTAIPGFEPSDDELPIGTLRKDISRLRQEGQRTEPLVIREALNGSWQKAIEQIPLPPPGQKKKKNKTPAVQPGRKEIRRPNPRLENNARHRQPLKRRTGHRTTLYRRRDTQVPGLTIPAPATDRIDELQVLCTAVASWPGDLKQEVAGDRRTRSILTERANGAQAERDAARQKYKLSVSPHPCQGGQADGRLKALRETYCLITTPKEPTARDLVECLVLQNSIADHRAEEAEKRVHERDEELRQLRMSSAELERNSPGAAEEIQPGQIESAQKEFHDVEQRFALVESPDLSDISLPSFSPVLVETLRKTLDTEFELMKQLQSVQRAIPGATTSEARELTTKYTPPASPDRPPAEFQTPEGQATAMETDTPTTTLEKERLEGRVRESTQLDLVQPQLEQSRQEKEAADTQIRELATQLELAQLQLEKVRTKADLEAAFADLDTVQAQLDEEHERNSKLQERVRALEKEIRAMRRQALLRPSLSVVPPGQASSGVPSGSSRADPGVLRTGD
ncbi:hypothetical protein R1flu_025509 [Riccia fluitans]|uniref:Uncharacterized protein n=1 Tax=Riccia fluitans TaxID=41844 RepID=A0ABD1XXZ1_9MARC